MSKEMKLMKPLSIALGATFATVVGLDLRTAIVVSAVVAVAYTLVGGLWAVALASFAAIHWGGPVAVGDNQLQLAIWLVYFTVSVMLTESAFLHFTLVFPEPWSWGPRHATRFVIYLPVVLGMVAAFMVLATAPDPVSDGWQGKFFILETLQSNLFALAGLVVLAIRCFRARPADGPRSITGPMAVAAWAAVLPWTAVMALESRGVAVPGGSDVYTLFFVITPLVFTWAILRYEPVSELEDAEVER